MTQVPARRPRLVALRARAVYPPSLRRGRHPVLGELKRLEREQWLRPEEVAERQRQRLSEVVRFALEHVPFYRQSAAERGVRAPALRLPEDLVRLPTLHRADLAGHATALIADGWPPAGSSWNHTGGSTGTPVSFLQDEEYRIVNLAATACHDRWAGWDFGVRTALLWGVDRDLAVSRGWRERLATWVARRQLEIDAFRMGETELRNFTERLTRFRPRVIRGYASALDLYATWLEAFGRPFPPPQGIISCAEGLDAVKRQRMARVFEAPVFDRYGSREFGLIASQCAGGTYHLNARGVWVEVLDGDAPAAPGALGRVVITGLVNRVMPLLRYETGDTAEVPTPVACACGRGLPLFGRVHGRVSDFIVSADGRLVHGEFFTHLFYGCGAVRAFALEQDARGTLTLRVVGDGPDFEAQVREAVDRMGRELGRGTGIRTEHVERIDPAPSGKRRFVSSALAPEHWLGGGRGGVRA